MYPSAIPLRMLTGAAVIALAMATAGPSPVAAQELPKLSTPVLVTSLGLSLEGLQVSLAARRAKIPMEFDLHAEPENLADAKSLFLAVNASLKGFGEAGIVLGDELARGEHLLDEAESRGILIVVLHLGGAENRDDLTNQLIALAAPRADLLIINATSDEDGLFAGIAEAGNIPLITVANLPALVPVLQERFAGGPGI